MRGSVALALVSLGITLAVAELLLRVFYPVGEVTYRIEPELLFELRPGASRIYLHDAVDGGGWSLSRINAQGFRGPALRQAPKRRVVVYGDSFVHAAYSSLPVTFAAQLQMQLGDETEVVNAGVRAYGPDQSLLHLERTLPQLAPDAVVFAVFSGNDFGDLIRNKLFRIDDTGRLKRNAIVIAPELEALFDQHPIERLALAGLYRVAKRGVKLSRRRSPTATGVAENLRRCREEFEAYRADDVAAADVFDDHYDADLALEPEGEGSREKRRLMQAVLVRVAEQTRGIPTVVVVIPSALDIAPGLGGLAIPVEEWPAYDPRRLSRLATQAARRAGLPVVDLWDALESDAPQLFYARNRHWNARGQALAAAVVAPRLQP